MKGYLLRVTVRVGLGLGLKGYLWRRNKRSPFEASNRRTVNLESFRLEIGGELRGYEGVMKGLLRGEGNTGD